MNRIKNYAIVVAEHPQDLVKQVTKACGEGFLPLGGVSAFVTEEGKGPAKVKRNHFAQAMIMPYRPEDALNEVIASVNGHG